MLAPDDRVTQGPFRAIIVQRHFWTRHEDGQPAPVVVEALQNLALRWVEMTLATVHLTAGLHVTQGRGQVAMPFDQADGC